MIETCVCLSQTFAPCPRRFDAHLGRKNPTGFEDALKMVSPTGLSAKTTLKARPGANFPRTVDVNMQKTVALRPTSLTIPYSVAVPANKIKQRSIQLRAKIETIVLHIFHMCESKSRSPRFEVSKTPSFPTEMLQRL